MSKQNIKLDSLLYVLKNIETDVNGDLQDFYDEKKRREYRNDIIDLSRIDISLLTSYYMNSNDEAKKQFSDLLYSVYANKDDLETFLANFKNLYYLHKSDLTKTTQYGAAKRGILEFINKLKDEALHEEKLSSAEEKKILDKLFIIRKLLKYFNARPGTVEIKNIDNFILMLNMFEISPKAKNNALAVAIENNNKYYSKKLKTSNEEFE